MYSTESLRLCLLYLVPVPWTTSFLQLLAWLLTTESVRNDQFLESGCYPSPSELCTCYSLCASSSWPHPILPAISALLSYCNGSASFCLSSPLLCKLWSRGTIFFIITSSGPWQCLAHCRCSITIFLMTIEVGMDRNLIAKSRQHSAARLYEGGPSDPCCYLRIEST